MSEFYKMKPAKWNNATAELTLEQEGAYLRIVNAINLHDAPVPNVDRVLAGMFRTPPKKARSLVQDLILAGKITIEGRFIFNEKAMEDVESRMKLSQNRSEIGAKGGRTKADNASKSLKTNQPPVAIASARIEENRIDKLVVVVDADARSRARPLDLTHRERLLEAMGVDKSGLTGRGGQMLGSMADMEEARKWSELGLTDADQIGVIREVMGRKVTGQKPSGFRYFNQAMERLCAARQAPALKPDGGMQDARPEREGRYDGGKLSRIIAGAIDRPGKG